jgi:POT family proton-dependent oligopeptide transporter
MAMGCLLLGVSFVPLIYIAHGLGETLRISFLWLVGCTWIYTIGELYLSPIGLSLVTKVAPTHTVSLLMGVWLATDFVGSFLAGWLGSYWSAMTKADFFLMIAAIGALAGLLVFVARRWLAILA